MNGPAGRAPAVLFDIDGTLIDSNYLHVHAWSRAFHDTGLNVEAWRIHRSIGMDGSTLLKCLCSEVDEDTHRDLKDLHSRYFKDMSSLLRPLPGAREVMQQVHDFGLQVVLATSAPQDELEILRGVLDSDDLVTAVTSSDDVGTGKPNPGVVLAALKQAQVDAEHAAFVGDSVWDVVASSRAGVPTIGVLTGGVSRSELDNAGATAVFDDVRHLTANIAITPIGALV
ncbi:MAG: HAD family hydrolase [Mycobacteriaceae bacterium]|nr:HAD family hydrolase [Mycobacteriaceae bacterium]